MTSVICDYCQSPAPLVTGLAIYPHRPDLSHKKFYQCAPCAAWVGCHDGTETPLGRLANAELRAAKGRAHTAFDRLWKGAIQLRGYPKKKARGKAYVWLAEQLGIDGKDCHIGMFDVEQCNRVVSICEPYLKRKVA